MLDLILDDAVIRTFDDDRPRARAVGIWQGRVVGFDDDVRGLNARRRLNLHGATVLPGFHDAHCHTAWYGLMLAGVDLTALPGGLPEVYDRIAAAAARTPAREWIQASGYGLRDYNGQFPDLAVLDRITDGRPLVMRQQSGHTAFVNTEALRRAGMLEPDFRDPEGGRVVRDASGRPTGLLEETAQELVQDLVRPHSLSSLIDGIERATQVYAGQGITSFGDAGIAAGGLGHSPLELQAYQLARDSERLHARAQVMPAIEALHPIDSHPHDDRTHGLDLGLCTGFGDDWLRVGPTKVFLDGALSSETAALRAPYAREAGIAGASGVAEAGSGYLLDDPQSLRRRILEAYRAGWSLAVHAIGDRAVDLAVACLVEAQEAFGRRRYPNRIEHAALLHDEHLPVLARHGIAVTPQAAFAQNIGDAMNASVGPDRRHLIYRARAFVDGGVLLAGSSDRPCAEGAPLHGIQAFVDRLTATGDIMGSAEERVTVEQALLAYTRTAAQAMGESADRGTLTPGKLADLVVLGEDPLEMDPSEIHSIPVVATLAGGEFTHTTL